MPQMTGAREQALRWHAIQLAAQLPEKPEEARRVLDLTREILDGFVAPGIRAEVQLAVRNTA